MSTQLEAAIEYKIRVKSASEHLYEVEMSVSLPANSENIRNSVVVSLPSWIPGSYMIRDFSRNLHCLQTSDSNISLTQLDKQQWELNSQNKTALNTFKLNYVIYAYDLSVRSAFINDEYAFFNGTSVFLCVQDFEYLPHKVFISPEQDILANKVVTALPIRNSEDRSYIVSDYFELIDHPVIIGKYNDYSFKVKGHCFHLVFTGSHKFDFTRIAKDLTPIIEHHIALFGDFPCKEYWFMTLVCDQGFGGLEHVASTVLQYSRFDLPVIGDSKLINKEYQQFLSLCSHELFHTWHVKRIKPKVMHKPNLYQEVYSPQLWIYEGFTSLYDDLSLARTKIITQNQYVQILNETITRLVRNPGNKKQSASLSSFEAWNKFYKQDAGSVNHIVSYYNKGALIALCLDITLRQRSNNEYSLDHVMTRLWQLYGKKNIGTNDDVIAHLCKDEFNIDITSFLHLTTQTTADLPMAELLAHIGLTLNLRTSHHFKDKGGKSALESKHDIGATFNFVNKDLKVVSVLENRAASLAGLQIGDKIIAFDKWQCDEKRFLQVLNQHELDEKIPLDVIRDGRLLTLQFTTIPAIADTCEIEINDAAIFDKWLGILNTH